MNNAPILEAKDISKFYEDGQVKAIDGISLQVKRGEILIIHGPSGSGKSTLMHLLGGLDSPNTGEVFYEGRPIIEMCRNRGFRVKNLGFIFQTFYLWQNLNTLENIMLPLLELPVSQRERFLRVKEIINEVGLADKINTSVKFLSVGQRQRVAVARALIAKPSVILADEPTGSLDSRNKESVLQLLRNINKKFKVTIVMVTHENTSREYYDRHIHLLDGKICS
jgi:putative ABC transport system ATP-binding protein